MQYRPDIDGLRALAVLSVLFFHLGFTTFGGGFVGVDVFFVISGFLITQLIRAEVEASSSFSFANFYVRRVRRLAPALLFTLALSFMCAVMLFSPSDLQRFSGALVHSVLSISNFYFWAESGYFDTATLVKPLLHTWSLSVEEQFYLIWPATLVLLLTKTPRYTVPVFLALAGIASLAINIDFYDGYSGILAIIAPSANSWFTDGPATIYFLAPFRIFEFAIGAALVFVGERKAANRMIAELLSLLGLAMILWAVLFFTEQTPFPTVYALLPCVGAALLIYFASGSRYCKLVLGHPGMVRLGLISYSLYLIHWPMIVFLTYYTKAELTIGQQWAIVLASIVAAEFMFRWVETPVRKYSGSAKRAAPGRLVFTSVLTALLISAPAISAWNTQGWTWRFGQGETVEAFGDIKQLEQERADYLMSYHAEQVNLSETGRTILVVGDSLGHDLLIGLAQNIDDDTRVQFLRYDAMCYKIFLGEPDSIKGPCADVLAGLEKSRHLAAADEVYIAYSMGAQFWATEFAPLIQFVQGRARPEARIVMFGRRPQFLDFHSIAISMLSEGKTIEQVEQRAREISGDLAPLDRQMRVATGELGVDFISSFDMACTGERCKFFTDEGTLLFWDKHHWTVQGATLFGYMTMESLAGVSEVAVEAQEPVTEPSAAVADAVTDSVAIAIAPNPAPAPPPPPAGAQNMSLEEAVVITRSYMSELSRIGIQIGDMYDIALLPHSKSKITVALLTMMDVSANTEASANYRTGIILLAHFQPGVGEATVSLDQISPSEQRWQEIVDLEKQSLRKTLTNYQQAKFSEQNKNEGKAPLLSSL